MFSRETASSETTSCRTKQSHPIALRNKRITQKRGANEVNTDPRTHTHRHTHSLRFGNLGTIPIATKSAPDFAKKPADAEAHSERSKQTNTSPKENEGHGENERISRADEG